MTNWKPLRTFTLKIETDNAAFDDDNMAVELNRLLVATGDQILRHYDGRKLDGVLHDVNGNAVGAFMLKP